MGTEYSFFGFFGIVLTWPTPNDQLQFHEMTDKMLSETCSITLSLPIPDDPFVIPQTIYRGYRNKYGVVLSILYPDRIIQWDLWPAESWSQQS